MVDNESTYVILSSPKQVVALDERDVGNMLVPATSLRNF